MENKLVIWRLHCKEQTEEYSYLDAYMTVD